MASPEPTSQRPIEAAQTPFPAQNGAAAPANAATTNGRSRRRRRRRGRHRKAHASAEAANPPAIDAARNIAAAHGMAPNGAAANGAAPSVAATHGAATNGTRGEMPPTRPRPPSGILGSHAGEALVVFHRRNAGLSRFVLRESFD